MLFLSCSLLSVSLNQFWEIFMSADEVDRQWAKACWLFLVDSLSLFRNICPFSRIFAITDNTEICLKSLSIFPGGWTLGTGLTKVCLIVHLAAAWTTICNKNLFESHCSTESFLNCFIYWSQSCTKWEIDFWSRGLNCRSWSLSLEESSLWKLLVSFHRRRVSQITWKISAIWLAESRGISA